MFVFPHSYSSCNLCGATIPSAQATKHVCDVARQATYEASREFRPFASPAGAQGSTTLHAWTAFDWWCGHDPHGRFAMYYAARHA
jgi:hypothetical protein